MSCERICSVTKTKHNINVTEFVILRVLFPPTHTNSHRALVNYRCSIAFCTPSVVPVKCYEPQNSVYFITYIFNDSGGSRTAATSKMERFVIIVNGFQPLTMITKPSILDVAAVLYPPLRDMRKWRENNYKNI